MLQQIWQKLKSGWLFYLAASALARLAGFVLIPLYTTRLSPADYGEYSLVASLTTLLSSILSLGLGAAVIKAFFDGPREEAEARVGSVARVILVIVASLTVVASLAIALFWDPVWITIPTPTAVLFVVGCAGLAITSIPDGFLRASQNARAAAMLQLVVFFSSTFLGIFLVAYQNRGLQGAVEAISIGTILTGVFGVFFGLRLPGHLDRQLALKWVPFAIPFVFHFAANWMLSFGDRWVIASQNNDDVLGTYYLASQLCSPVAMVITAWNEMESAKLGELFREQTQPTRAQTHRRMRNYLLVACAASLCVTLALPFLPLVIGKNFLNASYYVPMLLLAHLIDSQYYESSNLLFFSGKTRLIPIITVMAGVFNLIFTYLLFRAFGPAGIVSARVLSTSFRTGVTYLLARYT